MTGKVLVVGGTGPSGPPLVQGLLDRGHDVTVFHTGNHEVPDGPVTRHVHGDPFDRDATADALGDERFDTVVATYGRVRVLAEHFANKCEHFIVVGGAPVYAGYVNPNDCFPYGMQLPVRENRNARVAPDAATWAGYNAAPVRRTEDFVFGLADGGASAATYMRYPTVYGPRNPHAFEWTVVRRVLDGRPWMILSDGGGSIHSRVGARNAAHALLLAVEQPERCAGKAYHVGDDDLVTVRQWAELVVHATGGDLGFRFLPSQLVTPGRAVLPFTSQGSPSCILDTTALRNDLGYHDVVALRDGLAETVRWILANVQEMRTNPNIADPFDYEAEDQLVTAYEQAMIGLAPYEEPFVSGIGQMTVPQTRPAAR